MIRLCRRDQMNPRGNLHHAEDRLLTVMENKRIQSIPDDVHVCVSWPCSSLHMHNSPYTRTSTLPLWAAPFYCKFPSVIWIGIFEFYDSTVCICLWLTGEVSQDASDSVRTSKLSANTGLSRRTLYIHIHVHHMFATSYLSLAVDSYPVFRMTIWCGLMWLGWLITSSVPDWQCSPIPARPCNHGCSGGGCHRHQAWPCTNPVWLHRLVH